MRDISRMAMSIKRISILLRHTFSAQILVSSLQYPKMDVNHDGKVTASDLTLISRACGSPSIDQKRKYDADCRKAQLISVKSLALFFHR